MFYLGLAVVLLATWFPFIPSWPTFIHMWRVELAASVFLFSALGYLLIHSKRISVPLSISTAELWLIIFPLLAFITWSAMSIAWAPSWRSAAHHTLVWIEYLVFYLVARYLVDEDRNFGTTLRLLALVFVLFAIPAIIEYLALTMFGGDTQFRGRFAKYGEQVVTILPLLLILTIRAGERRFRMAVAGLAAIWLMVYCTAGRANIILFAACVAGIGALVAALPRYRPYRRRLAICVLTLIIVPVPFYLFSLAVSAGDVPIVARFQDVTGSAYSSNFRTLMNSVSLEMIRSEPLAGIGADNYGMQFNRFREQYAAANPGDPDLAYGEIGIVGHAHNEYLQIAAELGLTGAAIFGWFLIGIGVMAFRALRVLRSRSLLAIASVMGLAMFLASSAVSAYSFRLMQNGIVFFIVLAVAAKTTLADKRERTEVTASEKRSYLVPACAAGMLACVLLASYSVVRVSSVIITTRANYTEDLGHASRLYQTAIRLDQENPDARNNFAMRLFQEDRFADAVPLLQESIDIGRGQSVDFSYLASAQSLAGDNAAAERTMAGAVRLYPHSTFVLTRHAALLTLNERAVEAAGQLDRARKIDASSTNSWWTMIHSGAQAVTDKAFRGEELTQVKDLQPQISMYALLDERHVRFPEERKVFRRR